MSDKVKAVLVLLSRKAAAVLVVLSRKVKAALAGLLRRVVAVLAGLSLLIGGTLGQPTSQERATSTIYLLGAVVGSLGAWLVYRSRDRTLTWKPVATWAAAGSIVSALAAPVDDTSLGGGIGFGLAAGLLLALVHYGLRGPLPEADDSESVDPPGDG